METVGLITRSHTTDYTAFPRSGAPIAKSIAYRRLTRVESPTLILKARDGGAIEFFLSGIMSARRSDHVGTPIRYTLFGVAASDNEVQSLRWAAEKYCSREGMSSLGQWLDEEIGDAVEQWMNNSLDATNDSSGTPPFLEKLKNSWLEQGADPHEVAPHDKRKAVGRYHAEAPKLLHEFVSVMRKKEQGSVLLLNLARIEEYEVLEDRPMLVMTSGAESPREIVKKKRLKLRQVAPRRITRSQGITAVILILALYLIYRLVVKS